MQTNKSGLDLIKEFEGFRSHAYKCPAGVWTIGYGSTRYPDGAVVEPDDVVTQDEAHDLLVDTVIQYQRVIDRSVTVSLSQNEYDALISFVYNVGTGAFVSSTLLKLLNDGASKLMVARQFDRWNKGGGKVLPGLVKRRAAERALFLGE